ncbi:MAG: tRNA lysidine(34) synthetase TilS [Clostridiales bacterium]|nr:tRNA lysidine(34) synthetase TilS [Clostridiales bacterium]
MIKQMQKTIDEHNLLEIGDKIIIGLSGGPDSVSMLYGLLALKEKYHIEIYAVHLNHMIRGALADKDQEYVENLCKSLNIPIYSFRKDIPKMSRELKMTEEEVGRKVRYELFEKVCSEVNCDKIAIAQNKNDQVETFIMRVIRGAAIDGLASIKYIRDEKFIRPLLGCARKDIEDFCEKNNLKPRIDHTNYETEYFRNKVRIKLIPHMIETYNPNLIDTIYRNVEIIQKDLDYLESEALKEFNKFEMNNISLDRLNELHPAILSRVLRKIIENKIGYLRDVSSGQIEELEKVILRRNTGKKVIIKGIVFQVENRALKIYKSQSDNKIEFSQGLSFGENTVIVDKNEAYKIILEIIDGNKIIKGDKLTAYFDYNKIKGDIILRNRKDGDKFAPLGLKGKSKKLKDYFIDAKIPREKRDKILIFQDLVGIFWIGGYRLSENYKVCANTIKMLKIKIELL